MKNFKQLLILVFIFVIGATSWSISVKTDSYKQHVTGIYSNSEYSHFTPEFLLGNVLGVTPPLGAYKKYYPSGKLKEQGIFLKHRYHYSLKRFYENGQLQYEANYNDKGKEEGKVNYYFPNGQLEFEYTAINGVPTGKATRFSADGSIRANVEYDSEGSLIAKAEFSAKD